MCRNILWYMCVCVNIYWLIKVCMTAKSKTTKQNKKQTKKHWQEKWYIWMWVVVFEQQIWSSLREHFRKKNIYTKPAHCFIVSEGFLHEFACCQNYNLWVDAFRSCFWTSLVLSLALLLRICLNFFPIYIMYKF